MDASSLLILEAMICAHFGGAASADVAGGSVFLASTAVGQLLPDVLKLPSGIADATEGE